MKQQFLLCILFLTFTLNANAQKISGELKKWHTVTLDFDFHNCLEGFGKTMKRVRLKQSRYAARKAKNGAG